MPLDEEIAKTTARVAGLLAHVTDRTLWLLLRKRRSSRDRLNVEGLSFSTSVNLSTIFHAVGVWTSRRQPAATERLAFTTSFFLSLARVPSFVFLAEHSRDFFQITVLRIVSSSGSIYQRRAARRN
jgi:hypothetical protein